MTDVLPRLKDACIDLSRHPTSRERQTAFLEVLCECIRPTLFERAIRLRRRYKQQTEDVLQAALYALFERSLRLCRAGRIDPRKTPGDVASYFHQILNREIAGQTRKLRRQQVRTERIQRVLVAFPSTHTIATSDRESRQRLANALRKLRYPDRQIIRLRFFRQLTHAEIAKHLKITAQASRARLARALGRLGLLY